MQITLNLKSGQRARQQTAGSYFLILDDGGSGAVVDTTFRAHSEVIEEIRTARRGTKARMASGQFTQIELIADRDCTLEIIISNGAVDVDMFAGASVNATIVGLPVPVSNDRGSAGNPVFINGTVAGLPAAVAVANSAPVAMGAAYAAIVAANANRVSLRLTNKGGNVVALGAAGLTFANGAILLQPGDTWIEERAANLAWGGICDVGLASSIGVQEVTA